MRVNINRRGGPIVVYFSIPNTYVGRHMPDVSEVEFEEKSLRHS
jgi:hypothetical protein